VKTERTSEDAMLIDCDTCEVRGLACGDCVVTYLLGATRVATAEGVGPVEFDAQERAALDVLASSGLVPPLRLVPPGGGAGEGNDASDAVRRHHDGMKSAG
jgi:hypothetical protein